MVIADCLREEEVTSGDIHEELTTRGRYHIGSIEESDDKDTAMDVPIEEDFGQEFAEAWDEPQHRPPLPKLDILAVDADEEPQVDWKGEDDVKGGPLDPHEVKTARQKEIQYLWDREMYEYATEAEARARTGRNLDGLKWIDTNKGSAEVPRYHSREGR